jgi:DNA-binding beta-propeller fold protein YncE
LDKNKNIYVVDKGGEVVTVFNSNGEYFKKAGLVGDSLSILNNPVAVAIDDRGVLYVCNDGDSSIYRFKLSNSLDEDLKPED